jgi:hypothetical protein
VRTLVGGHLNFDVRGACVQPKNGRNSHLGIFLREWLYLLFICSDEESMSILNSIIVWYIVI